MKSVFILLILSMTALADDKLNIGYYWLKPNGDKGVFVPVKVMEQKIRFIEVFLLTVKFNE